LNIYLADPNSRTYTFYVIYCKISNKAPKQ
jgi:hypothetical protein